MGHRLPWYNRLNNDFQPPIGRFPPNDKMFLEHAVSDLLPLEPGQKIEYCHIVVLRLLGVAAAVVVTSPVTP